MSAQLFRQSTAFVVSCPIALPSSTLSRHRCSRQIRTRRSRTRAVRAGLYPEVDPPESQPNPAFGGSSEKCASGEKSASSEKSDSGEKSASGKKSTSGEESASSQKSASSEQSTGSEKSADSGVSSDSGNESGFLGEDVLRRARRLFYGPSDEDGPHDGEQGDSGKATVSPTQSEDRSWAADELDVAAGTDVRFDSNLADERSSSVGIQRGSDSASTSFAEGIEAGASYPLDVQRSSRALWKVGWWAWWIQLVLTSISAVIVLFALVLPGVNVTSSASAWGLVCAAFGVGIAFVSLLWTYGYTRLAIRIRRAQTKWIVRAPEKLAAYFRMALIISIAGMLVSLVGLQAIVGALLARLFGAGIATTPYATLQQNQAKQAVFGGLGGVQPIDILVVQASANAMSALLSAVLSAIWFKERLVSWTRNAPKQTE